MRIDGTGGPPIEKATVVVDGDRISAVGSAGAVTMPDGAEVIDASGMHLLPGLIDAHVHITNSFTNEPDRDADTGVVGASTAEVLLLSGFTTVRSLGSRNFQDVLLREAIDAGEVPGPRVIASSQGLTDGLHAAVDGDRVAAGDDPANEQDIRAFVRERIEGRVDWLKIFASRSSRAGGTPTYSLEQLEWAIDEADRAGVSTSAHAHAAEAARRAIEAGARTIEHGALLDESVLELMIERGTYYMPNLYLSEYYLENGDRFGYTAEQVTNLPRFDIDEMIAYYDVVREDTLQYLKSISAKDLETCPQPDQRPGYSIGKMFSHVIVEESQHVGQVAYLRGLQRGLNK